MTEPQLTPEQEEKALKFEQALMDKAQQEIQKIARLMASREDAELLDETEFQVRDLLHDIGNHAVNLELETRKKTDTSDAV